MAAGASVPYSPVPTVESTGSLGGGESVSATPQAFGSQVGAATEAAGDKTFELAQKQQGIVNEAAYTSADTQLAIKAGALNAEYKTLTGFAAKAAYPKYQADLEAARLETRSALTNPAAQHGFDLLATRTIANHIIDGSNHAATQFKDGLRDTYSDSTNVHVQQILQQPPQQAADDEQFGHTLGAIKWNTIAQIDDEHPGLAKDPETGEVKFDEATPEGKQLKAEYQQKLDANISQAYVNRYTVLAKTNPIGAYDKYQSERDKIPRGGQVALDASFAPKILDAHKQTAVGLAINEAAQAHWDKLTNPAPQAAIDTVMKNEGGYVPVDGSSGAPAIYGINQKFHPAEFAEAKRLTDAEGDAAGKKYAEGFYKTAYWDKKGVGELPPATQTIVMDGVVNHSTAFGDKLVAAAKDGASPQTLIDMRKDEYTRLAETNPEKYGASLEGWNARLDNLQQQTEGGKKTYSTNENGGPLSLADYYRAHSQDVLARGDEYAERQMPGDLALKRAVRQTLQNQINTTISNESAQHLMDNRRIVGVINGDLTKGKPVQSEEELRQLPGMSDLLDNVQARDWKFAEGIPIIIAKAARRNDKTNSPNGYDTVMRTLISDPDNKNAIRSEDHLIDELGKSEGTGINMKDFNDAKPAIELDQTLKDNLSKNMKQITNANGNVDGKGQERALAWYNQAMIAWKKNEMQGDKALSPSDFIEQMNQASAGVHTPSRMEQISNWLRSKPTAPQAAAAETVSVISPTGQTGTIPVANLEKAIAAGFKRAQ